LNHWSSRRLAREVGMGTRTVQRIWAEAGLQPYRSETFKFSTDPELERRFVISPGSISRHSGVRDQGPS
jgi:hypothetical protein